MESGRVCFLSHANASLSRDAPAAILRLDRGRIGNSLIAAGIGTNSGRQLAAMRRVRHVPSQGN